MYCSWQIQYLMGRNEELRHELRNVQQEITKTISELENRATLVRFLNNYLRKDHTMPKRQMSTFDLNDFFNSSNRSNLWRRKMTPCVK